jgi:hypothetical protein
MVFLVYLSRYKISTYLGGVWDCSAPVFLAPLQLHGAKHIQLHELRSKKNVELEANSTFFLEYLKGYSTNSMFFME